MNKKQITALGIIAIAIASIISYNTYYNIDKTIPIKKSEDYQSSDYEYWELTPEGKRLTEQTGFKNIPIDFGVREEYRQRGDSICVPARYLDNPYWEAPGRR